MASKTRPCLRCNQWIPASRCEALPETRVCVKCSEILGGEFIYETTTQGVSKGGLKITGTEIVAIRKRRKQIERVDEPANP